MYTVVLLDMADDFDIVQWLESWPDTKFRPRKNILHTILSSDSFL